MCIRSILIVLPLLLALAALTLNQIRWRIRDHRFFQSGSANAKEAPIHLDMDPKE
jgi:hypothetical protein